MRQPAGANPLLWCVLLCVFAAKASAGSLGGALELQARSFFKQDRDRNSASVALFIQLLRTTFRKGATASRPECPLLF